jgi:hypothetical protein
MRAKSPCWTPRAASVHRDGACRGLLLERRRGSGPAETPLRLRPGLSPTSGRAHPRKYKPRSGSVVSLGAAAGAGDWTGYGKESDLRVFPRRYPAGRRNHLSLPRAVRRCPGPAGESSIPAGIAAPQSVTLPLRPVIAGKAREVRVILAASHQAAPGTKLGTVSFTAADGTVSTVDLVTVRTSPLGTMGRSRQMLP